MSFPYCWKNGFVLEHKKVSETFWGPQVKLQKHWYQEALKNEKKEQKDPTKQWYRLFTKDI